MDRVVAAALTELNRVFANYPRRPVLDRCPHCGPPVPVDEIDLFSLTLKLGNTIGTRSDVKALLPMLLECLVNSTELDTDMVFGKLPQEDWHAWPPVEQRAIDQYCDAVWQAILAEFPSRLGAFGQAEDFLRPAAAAGIPLDRFLTVWDNRAGSAADRHLAALVSGPLPSDRDATAVRAWLARDDLRHRLFRAYERDHDLPWADELALAHDIAGFW
ncbi:hypothetical protein LTV02_02895 [Nocardia yamanashiensis]|uniref:hypothetical protein n=1 Tax=Nocardia yamanashiensis TaxID=209247 RepID=UPI001E489485|nr:hypothetical protein [Nocardia yamanashiensis]UGT42385.1 hypothetical protein LTV02_02895 [Nocardia yamanashiensis]